MIVILNAGDIVNVGADAPEPKSDINLFTERQKGFDNIKILMVIKVMWSNLIFKVLSQKAYELTADQKQLNKEL